MRTYALAISALIVAGCGANGSTSVTTTSTPPGNGGSPSTPPPPTTPPGDMGPTTGVADGGSGGGAGAGVDGGSRGGDGGVSCTQTQPVPIVITAARPTGLAVDDTNVYFTLQLTTYADWTLWRSPVDGGAAVEVGSTADSANVMLIVNATAVFTLNHDGQLLRWPKSGGAPLVMQARNNNVGVNCLANAFGYIFFCTNDAGFIQVVRTPEDGGGSPTVVSQTFLISGIAFDSAMYLWYDTPHGTFGGPAIGGTGAPISIARTDEVIGPIAVDDAHVYVGGGNGDILVADKRDGASFTTFAAGLPSMPSLIDRDGSLYAAAARGGSGEIRRYALDGSRAAATLATGDIGAVVVRGDFVYYTVPSENRIYRVCK